MPNGRRGPLSERGSKRGGAAGPSHANGGESGGGDQPPKRRRQARAFSRCKVIESRWRSMMAQVFSVSSSPVAKAEVLASSDQTHLAILPQPPPTASMTIGMKENPWL